MIAGPDLGGERDELVRRWTAALITTAYVPASRDAIEDLVGRLLDMLLDTLRAKDFSPDAAAEVGARLVSEQFAGPASLSRTVEVLATDLPAYAATDRVVPLLGSLTAGYVAALRARTLDQQETVKAALLKACQKAQRELRTSETKFRELFTSSAVGIAITDLDGTLAEANDAFGEIVRRPAAELVGGSLYELFHADDAGLLATTHQGLVDDGGTRLRMQRQVRLLDGDGETKWAHLAVSLLHDADGRPTGHVTMVEDVTDLHLLGERLSHQSLHDALTGLPNQQFFVSRLESVVGRPLTLCKIDLDGFTVVNDGLGRRVGDLLLRSVAARLESVVADETATVARFGADEFAILIENSPTTPDVATLAETINAELAEPVYLDDHGLAVTSCVGIVEHRGGPADPAELLRAAEATLRRLKATGPRQWGLLDTHRDAADRARCRLAAVMPGAWENGEITLEYQPLARLSNSALGAAGAVAGIQPLLRWDRPGHAPMSHEECLELADATGLALPLGEWMLRTACAQHSTWRRLAGRATPPLHVDLTPRQAADPDLVSAVWRTVQQSGGAAAHLRLGIPAPVLHDGSGDRSGSGSGDADDNVRVLAGMGVGIGLVECGGAADLLHLDDLPQGSVRSVRIARGLVRRAATLPDASSTAARALAGLLDLVHSYGATAIAGDISTAGQAGWWRSIGADVGQGPFFASPAPAPADAALPDTRIACR